MGYSCSEEGSCVANKEERPLKIEKFTYKELEIATRSFGGESFLGRGSHGCVYKGVLEGGKLVAVKKLWRGLNDESAFVNEIEILSKLHSPGLVNLVGISHHSKEKLLVVEFMANGTLYDILYCNPKPPSWSRRVHIALQIAKTIQALHNACPPVIHRDVKSSNVLIDDNWNARLGDFGLALRGHLEDIKLNSTPPAGTIGYLDPAYTTPADLSTKNDVFSFGILLLEIISSRKAIDVRHDPPSIVDWALPLIKENQFPKLSDPRLSTPKIISGIKQMAMIAYRCIRSDKERRPSMDEVVEELRSVSKSIPLPLWDTLRSRIKIPGIRHEKSFAMTDSPKELFKKGLSRICQESEIKGTGTECHESEISMGFRHKRSLRDLLNEITSSSGDTL